MTLDELREAIDCVDSRLLKLLNERVEYVKQVGQLKHKTGGPIYRPEREKAIIQRLQKENDGALSDSAIEAIFLELFATSRNIERPERVAYLGPEGSFTHQAAEGRFGAVSEYLPMSSIGAVFKAVEASRAKFAVVPIENNSDGFVGETLDNLEQTQLKIVADVEIGIHHCFATLSESLKGIEKIYSKDIAFGQCREFLNEHGLNDVELALVESTAKAAKLAANDPKSAAICSKIAANLYNVPVLFDNIEDNHNNTTRFIILSDFQNEPSGNDKTTILAKLPAQAGSLYEFLKYFYDRKINLTKIESRPATKGYSDKEDKNFQYWFYIEFEGHVQDAKVQEVMRLQSQNVKWLGSYVQN
jgi:chorismate mutase/prephenate dehydratase